MKRSDVRGLLKESLLNATRRIPLELWGAVASRALSEARPVHEILVQALNEYLRTATRKNLKKKRQGKRLRGPSDDLVHQNGRNSRLKKNVVGVRDLRDPS